MTGNIFNYQSFDKGVKWERERVIDVVNAARSGIIDKDLRCVIARIESGEWLNYDDE